MKTIKKVVFEQHPDSGYAKIGKTIKEFRDSKETIVEVVKYPHKNAAVCYQSIYNQLRRLRIRTVKATVDGDRVFLVKVKI